MISALKDYGVAHIGYVVKNREEVVDTLTKLFGIKNWKVYTFCPSRAWSYGKEVEGYSLKIAMGTLRDGSCAMEVIEPCTGDGVHWDFVNSGHSGLHHFAFSVQDYDHWRNYFAQVNVRVVFESETEDDVLGYRRCFYVEDDTLGCVYEIMEKPYFRK